MKTRLLSLLLLAAAALRAAVPAPITLTVTGDALHNLNYDFAVGSGKTITVRSGGTIDILSGGAINLPAGVVEWSDVNKTGSSLADLETRSAGALSSGTLLAARMPAMTGDATSTVGTVSLTLATVATGATTGGSTAIPVITFNNKGLVTGVTTAAVVAPAGTLTGTTLAANVVTSSLTSVGDVGTGTWSADVVAGAYGGTGVANTGKTITLGGNLTTSGAFATTLTATNTTTLTLPTTGTLATLAGSEALTNKTYNGNTWTAGTGTLTQAASSTLATVGPYAATLTFTNTTAVTFPTSGTLATTTGTIANATNIGITDDDSTAAAMYPVWVTSNSGFLPAKVSLSKFSFNPSTGTLTTTAGAIGGIGLSGNAITAANSLTSVAGQALTLRTGTFGTAVSIASATGSATFNADVLLGAGQVSVTRSLSTSGTIATAVTGDGTSRFTVDAAGRHDWGPGSGAVDVSLRRTSSGILTLGGGLVATTFNGNTWTAGTGTLTQAAGSSLITSGAFAATFTFSATTGVTFPTSGTLAALSGTNTWTGVNTFNNQITANYSPGTYPAGVVRAIIPSTTGAGAADGTTNLREIESQIIMTGSNNTAAAVATFSTVYNDQSGGTLASQVAMFGYLGMRGAGATTDAAFIKTSGLFSGAGNITGTLRYFDINPISASSSTGDVTGAITGVYIADIARATASSVTGIEIGTLTSSAGNTYGLRSRVNTSGAVRFNLYVDGTAPSYFLAPVLLGTTTNTASTALQFAASTAAAGGIIFGTDTTLYRSAADQLKTDDSFVAGGTSISVTPTSGVAGSVGVFTSGAVDSSVILSGASGQNRSARFRTAGVERWFIGANATAESAGTDAGSNLVVAAYNDSGVFIDTPLTITRVSGGNLTITRPISSTQSLNTGTTGAGTFAAGVSIYNQITAKGAMNASGDSAVRGTVFETEVTGAVGTSGTTYASRTNMIANGTAGTLASAISHLYVTRLSNAMNVTTGTGLNISVQLSGAGNLGTFTHISMDGVNQKSSTGDLTGAVVGATVSNLGSTSAGFTSITAFNVNDQTKGSGNAVAYATAMTIGSGGKYGFYSSGTAPNYSAAAWLLGTTTNTSGRLQFVSGTTAADGILFGTDSTTLYRNGSNSLKTDASFTVGGVYIGSTSTRSGPGACDVTTETSKVTTTGTLDALTLANGTDGQIKRIVHDVDGGSFILTPTTKTGFSTYTSTVVGETISLLYVTTRGWMVIGSYGGTIAP